jgi:hypothetical protein
MKRELPVTSVWDSVDLNCVDLATVGSTMDYALLGIGSFAVFSATYANIQLSNN